MIINGKLDKNGEIKYVNSHSDQRRHNVHLVQNIDVRSTVL